MIVCQPCDNADMIDQPNNVNTKLFTDAEYQKKSRQSPLHASNGQTPNLHCYSPRHQDYNNRSVHNSNSICEHKWFLEDVSTVSHAEPCKNSSVK